MTDCPCGSARDFEECCGPIIEGAPAPTAEALMRSRYTAYVTGAFDHIENTHAPEVQGDFNRSAAESMALGAKWTGLEIREVTGGGADDQTGTVEFVTRFKRGGENYAHHELNNFRRQDGRWVYVDGDINPKPATRIVEKVGRNDPCPCRSGKKFKKCCGA
ncbi:MAG: YchJ family protein [Rhodospirillales bacterium]|jgi:SEC-C motif-containing protein|nr:YchJ family protein [Rhodospirillales bacterium]MDP6643246.1 YchJ family protein [Rhodospirillales bacterium]|tara:strand:- start:848 stop:1330 length:483 start_codon:yes stop_codon:yes gene_type:complete